MVEQEHSILPYDEVPPAEPVRTHIEPGPAVEFALLPGQRIELSVSAEGLVRLRVAPPEAAVSTGVPSAPAESPTALPTEPEAQERVTIVGRVGTVPTFRTTPKGVRIARFTVAEHLDTESTTWHTVLAFGQRAEGLQEKPLEKGQAVQVIGYPHQREVTTRGVKRTVEEIYATAIKRR